MKTGLKQILCIILAASVVFALAACKKSDSESATGVIVERSFNSSPTPAPTTTPASTASASPSASGFSLDNADGAEYIAYANTDEVNVRDAASTSGNVLGKLAAGAIVPVIKKNAGNGWSQITYNGGTAYVATQYINMLAEGSSLATVGTATVNGSDVNLRAAANTSAAVIAKAASGTELTILKKDAGGGWGMFIYENKVVFAATRYIKFADGSGSSSASASPAASASASPSAS